MVQIQKDSIRQKIISSARDLFFQFSYRTIKISDISHHSGVSTGNIYRYFKNKEQIYRSIIPADFSDRFQQMFHHQITTLRGESPEKLPLDHPHHSAVKELLQFGIKHRCEVVILLERSSGTDDEGIKGELLTALINLVMQHFQIDLKNSSVRKKMLKQIYSNLLNSMIEILTLFEKPDEIEEAIQHYRRYHLGGLRYFFMEV